MKIAYQILIALLGFGMPLAALFHPKARKWVTGRKDWRGRLAALNPGQKPVLWMHCASLGEFEQGRPLLEKLKSYHANYFILLTFYSPSGYEVRKDFKGVDSVQYLPLDSAQNAKDFIRILKPKLFLLVKYELWLNLLEACFSANVTVVMVSAIFREKHTVFSSIFKGIYQEALQKMDSIFVQDKESQKRLAAVNIVSRVAGDTRFDRVKSITKNNNSVVSVGQLKGVGKLLVVGSSWEPEEDWIVNWYKNNPNSKLKTLLAPHNLNNERIEAFCETIPVKSVRYSDLPMDLEKVSVLVLDTMGILTDAYAYADFAIVGGGFNKSGIHNVLEPAVFGIPIMIGPNFEKFKEARDLHKTKGLVSVQDYVGFNKTLENWLSNPNLVQHMGDQNARYVQEALPATDIIYNTLKNHLKS